MNKAIEPYRTEALKPNPETFKAKLDWAVEMLFQGLMMEWKHNGLYGGEKMMIDCVRDKTLDALSLITDRTVEDLKDEIEDRINNEIIN